MPREGLFPLYLFLSLSLSCTLFVSMLPLPPVNSRRCASPGSQGAVVPSPSLLLARLSLPSSTRPPSRTCPSPSLYTVVSLFLSSTSFSLYIYLTCSSPSLLFTRLRLFHLFSLSLTRLPLFYSLSLTVSPSLSLPLGGKVASQREMHERCHNFSPELESLDESPDVYKLGWPSRYNPRADDAGCHPFDQSSVAI